MRGSRDLRIQAPPPEPHPRPVVSDASAQSGYIAAPRCTGGSLLLHTMSSLRTPRADSRERTVGGRPACTNAQARPVALQQGICQGIPNHALPAASWRSLPATALRPEASFSRTGPQGPAGTPLHPAPTTALRTKIHHAQSSEPGAPERSSRSRYGSPATQECSRSRSPLSYLAAAPHHAAAKEPPVERPSKHSKVKQQRRRIQQASARPITANLP